MSFVEAFKGIDALDDACLAQGRNVYHALAVLFDELHKVRQLLSLSSCHGGNFLGADSADGKHGAGHYNGSGNDSRDRLESVVENQNQNS